jgi:hypothetical protein
MRGESGVICNMLIYLVFHAFMHILTLDFRPGTNLE